MAGNKVETFLKSELKEKNALLFVLIDSEVSNLESSKKLAQEVEKIGASAILVGGSSATDQMEMSAVVKGIKEKIWRGQSAGYSACLNRCQKRAT